jgi:hypothetical protein
MFGFGFVGEMIAGAREENRALARAMDRIANELERRKIG